jgi:protein-disulfide isomerase
VTCAEFLRSLTAQGARVDASHADSCAQCAQSLKEAITVRTASRTINVGTPPDVDQALRRARQTIWTTRGATALAVAIVAAAAMVTPWRAWRRTGADIHLAPARQGAERTLHTAALRSFLGEATRHYALISNSPRDFQIQCLGCSDLDAARLVGALEGRFPELSGEVHITALRERNGANLGQRVYAALTARGHCPCPACVRSIEVGGDRVPLESLRLRPEVVSFRLVDSSGHVVTPDTVPPSEEVAPFLPDPARSVQAPALASAPPILGDPEAPVHILVFSEFTCPSCAEFEGTLRDLVAAYGGSVAVEFRHRPQPGDAFAEAASRAAVAAEEQGQFWPMHDRLVARGEALSRSELLAEASDLGLDGRRVAAMLDAPALPPALRRDLADADALDVSEVPTAFVNGNRVAGVPSLASLRRAVDVEIAYARLAPRSADDAEAQAFPFLVQGLFDLDTAPCRAADALRRAVALAPARSLVRDGAEQQLALLDRAH